MSGSLVNTSSVCLSLKSFEQVSSVSAWRLILKQGREQGRQPAAFMILGAALVVLKPYSVQNDCARVMSDGRFYHPILSADKKSADFCMTHER